MRRLLAFFMALFIVFVPVGIFAQGPATPTDLFNDTEYMEFEDDDFGYIEGIEPRVFIKMDPNEVAMYDEITLIAILMDFPDGYTIEWQYSKDQEEWFVVEGENKITYTFVVTPDNYDLWYRVCVTI